MVTHESGATRDIQCVFYESTVPRSYLGWGQSSQLGFSLGLAMGAKLANPDKLVVNVMGDGAAGMTGMDWETASRENIPILSVIKNDAIFSGYDRNIPTAIEKFWRVLALRRLRRSGQSLGLPRREGEHGGRVAPGAPARHPRHAGRPARGGGRVHRRNPAAVSPAPRAQDDLAGVPSSATDVQGALRPRKVKARSRPPDRRSTSVQ